MHKTKIIHWRGERYRIDELIAPLLLNMWRLGIKTTNSCQGTCGGWCNKRHRSCEKVDKHGIKYTSRGSCHDHVWIVFHRPEDATAFANVVATWGKDDPMYDAVTGVGPRKGRWTWSAKLDNWGIHYEIKRHRGGPGMNYKYYDEKACFKNKFNMQCVVIFPRKDLPYVEEKINAALAKKKRTPRLR